MPRRGKKWSGAIREFVKTLSEDQLANAVGMWMLERGYDGVGKQVAVKMVQGIADILAVRLPSGEVTLVEIKRSIQDFYADEKIFELLFGYTVCAHRCYVACEAGLIDAVEIPDPWGLIWVHPRTRQCVIIKKCKHLNHSDSNRISLLAVKALLRNLSRKRFECEFMADHHPEEVRDED